MTLLTGVKAVGSLDDITFEPRKCGLGFRVAKDSGLRSKETTVFWGI